jgi:hypothetical protein
MTTLLENGLLASYVMDTVKGPLVIELNQRKFLSINFLLKKKQRWESMNLGETTCKIYKFNIKLTFLYQNH